VYKPPNPPPNIATSQRSNADADGVVLVEEEEEEEEEDDDEIAFNTVVVAVIVGNQIWESLGRWCNNCGLAGPLIVVAVV
jgi:hypothetical protein